MSVKLLYVLVSQSSDYYTEQAVLSIMSAKYRMPGIAISLLMDQSTKDGLDGFRVKILDLVDELIVVQIDNPSPLIRSRILKTKMRSLVKGDFLYVDVDSVWAGSIDESDFVFDVMGVLDANCELKKHRYQDYINKQFLQLNYTSVYQNHINGGVLYMKDSSKALSFSDDWNSFWQNSCKKGICFDQPALHQTIDTHQDVFGLLDGAYNAQIAVNLNYFATAKVIHYHPYGGLSDTRKFPYKFQQRVFWDSLKKNGLNDDVVWMIRHPQACFDNFFQFKSADEINVEQKKLYGLMMTIMSSSKRSAKLLSDIGEIFARLVGRLYK